MPDYFELIANGGVLVILAWLVWFQNRRQFPNMIRDVRHEAQQERAIFASSVQEIVKALNRLTRLMLISIAKQGGEEDVAPLLKSLEESDDDSRCVICPFKRMAEKAMKEDVNQ